MHSRCPMPYMYQYYNVICQTEDRLSNVSSIPARFMNAIAKGLNANHMPRIILIIPDGDILKAINHFSFGVSTIIGHVLEWIIKNIDSAIESKKDELRKRKPGTLVANKPRILWLCMPDRPNGTSPLLEARKKFNNILEDILCSKKNHYITCISNKIAYPINFTQSNYLNERGKELFWIETNRAVEKFNYNKDSMLPLSMAKPQIKQDQQSSHGRKSSAQIPPLQFKHQR